MAPLRTLCLAVGMVASATSEVVPGSTVYSLKGGGSGMEQQGDYVENKIARRVYSVFGAAADEAANANKHVKDAAKSARQSVRDSGQHVKDAARSARESVKIGWLCEEKEADVSAPEKKMWVGGATADVIKEQHALVRFFRNPNNAFAAQALVVLVFGTLHLFSHEKFGSILAEPLCNLIGLKFLAVTPVLPHIKLVGAYLVGVLVSDILAYKSSSPGFKRGKVWHEMGSGITLSVVCLKELFSEDFPADILPHCIAAVLFASWYAFLSSDY